MPPRLPADARARAIPLRGRMVATNSVRVTFERPPRASDPAHSRDALNPSNWTVSPVGGGIGPAVLAVRPVADSRFVARPSPRSFPPVWPLGLKWMTVTELTDGRLLVAGGSNAFAGTPTADCYLVDPLGGTVTAGTSMPAPKAEHTATLLADGTVLVAGGSTNDAYVYHPRFDAWTTIAPPPNSHLSRPCAIRLESGNVLLAGGYSDGHLNATSLYVAETREWINGPWMTTARDGARLVRVGPRDLLIVGGRNSVVRAERLSFATMAWTQVASDSSTVGYSPAVVAMKDGRVFVGSGWTSRTVRNTQTAFMKIYDPLTDAWQTIAPPAFYGAYAEAAHLCLDDGRVLLMGGGDSGLGVADGALFDPSTDTWEELWPADNAYFDVGWGTVLMNIGGSQVFALGGENELGLLDYAGVVAVGHGPWGSSYAAPSEPPGARNVDLVLAFPPDSAVDVVASASIEVAP